MFGVSFEMDYCTKLDSKVSKIGRQHNTMEFLRFNRISCFLEGGWGNNLQKFSNMADSDAAGWQVLRLMLQGRQRQKPKTSAPERDKLIAYWWIIIT